MGEELSTVFRSRARSACDQGVMSHMRQARNLPDAVHAGLKERAVGEEPQHPTRGDSRRPVRREKGIVCAAAVAGEGPIGDSGLLPDSGYHSHAGLDIEVMPVLRGTALRGLLPASEARERPSATRS